MKEKFVDLNFFLQNMIGENLECRNNLDRKKILLPINPLVKISQSTPWWK